MLAALSAILETDGKNPFAEYFGGMIGTTTFTCLLFGLYVPHGILLAFSDFPH